MPPTPKGHFHTGVTDIVLTALGVIVVVHVLRVAAGVLVDHQATAGAGKVLAAFALSEGTGR